MSNVLLQSWTPPGASAEALSRILSEGEAIQTPLSPELALVDPDLAAVARMLLPDPVVADRPPPPPALATAAPAVPVSLPPRRELAPSVPPTTRLRLAAIAATGLAALTAGAFGFALADRGTTGETRAGDASPAALQAQAARQSRAARTYVWPAVPGADAYAFELRRGTVAVFRATTREGAVQLPPRLQLPPGRYTWSVTPTFREPRSASARRPVVEGTFLVPAS